MINAADADFHEPDQDEPTWAETNFFGFYSAEVPLNIGVYALFRTNLGIDTVLVRPLPEFNALYANGHDLAHPYLSPLFGDFSKGLLVLKLLSQKAS